MMQAINHIRVENNKAYVVGHGYLKAEMVARMHVDEQASIEAVMEHYNLTAAEVYACLTYYYDNREILDRQLEETLTEIDANAIKSSAHIEKIRSRHKSK